MNKHVKKRLNKSPKNLASIVLLDAQIAILRAKLERISAIHAKAEILEQLAALHEEKVKL